MRVLFLENHHIWIYGLPNGFRDAGHEVLITGIEREDTITEKISQFKPDLALMLGWTEQHVAAKRKWIRKCISTEDIPLIYWATEDPIHSQVLTVPFIMQARPDFVFTVSKELVAYYEKLGFPAAHLDFGYHPSVHKRTEKMDEYSCRLAVVANAYPGVIKVYPDFFRLESLAILIVPLLKAGLRIDFWGVRWHEMDDILGVKLPREFLHGYLPYEDAYKVYNSADIVIGLQNTKTQVTMRTYEILGSGGFLLTSATPAVNELFESGKQLIAVASPEETLAMVQFYLDRPDEREAIRKQGQAAVAGHSYRHRAESIIAALKARKII
ncbi:MAG: CgeB family protein [Negativicutes bacterium]